MATETLNEDFLDALRCFLDAGVDFLVVGAHALAHHGVVRATGDLDLWIRCTDENAARALCALREFGAPVVAAGLTAEDLAKAGTVYQVGLPPRRVDILNEISGVAFQEAWSRRSSVRIDDLQVPVLDRESLLVNKRASGRPKDLADLAALDDERDDDERDDDDTDDDDAAVV